MIICAFGYTFIIGINESITELKHFDTFKLAYKMLLKPKETKRMFPLNCSRWYKLQARPISLVTRKRLHSESMTSRF